MMNKLLNNKPLIIMSAVLCGLITAGIFTGVSADQSNNSQKVHAQTAHKSKAQHVSEQDFNTVQLSANEMQHLGVQTVAAKIEPVQVTKSYGAQVIIPLGQRTQMLAPVAGKLIVPNPALFKAGVNVKPKQVLYEIQPILTADTQTGLQNSLTDAKGAVTTAQTKLDAAKVRLDRAQQLLTNLVGSQKNVDDATEQYEVAQTNVNAAQLRYQALTQSVQQGAKQHIVVTLPEGGEISNLLAMPNQLVAAGSPIVEITQLETLWVKVPVPLSDIEQLDEQAPAMVQAMSANSNNRIKALAVNAPPTADPLTGATYRYYAIDNSGRHYNPAQRVLASLSMQQSSDAVLTVPWSAVVLDIYGGSWVYVQKGEGVFARQRVFVDRVVGERVVLRHGLAEGALVVSQGALELLGVETGVSH